MSKYSNKFKLEVVKYFVDQYHGYKAAVKYDVFGLRKKTLEKWYKKFIIIKY